MYLKGLFVFPVHLALQLVNLALWAILVISFGLIKLIIPFKPLTRVLNTVMNFCMLAFGKCSVFFIRLFNPVTFDYRVHGEIRRRGWYLMMANHLSYLDIILLIEFSSGRIPAPKFFLKKELIWLPFVGLGAWALDMPFMRRYSSAYVTKNPHLKGKDIETTRRYCEKFKAHPTTVINFVEGTRFTYHKHRSKRSPYQFLLPPKAGGIAFTLAAMGELFTNILDVTLYYPDNTAHPMLAMLSGAMRRICLDVNIVEVDNNVIGDYFNDEHFKQAFQGWLNNKWHDKDTVIEQLLENQG
nr:acyltransferase [Aestuariibacter salexigens]